MTAPAVWVENISKKFDRVKAVDRVSFAVQKGELFGIIGPDGAGKTTLIRILTTLLLPDEGKATVAGYDVISSYKKVRHLIGYMPGRFSLYQDLSVEENLEFYATVFGTTISENYELVRDIYKHLEPFKNRLAGKLSGGMKQKLALSCALIHKPELLFLDEPTTGVDAISRIEFWDMLKRLKKRGISIIVSTPYMDEALRCDRVALMQEGRFLDIDEPEKIIGKYDKKLYSIHTTEPYLLMENLRENVDIQSVIPFGDHVHFTTRKDVEIDPGDLQEALIAKGFKDIAVKIIKPGIEDCFMDLMNIEPQ
ncbi:MAG: ABC transporter ATP-binding protein [Bacteroidales bacterium]|nr:ABC transporter ATP-binding protein [Bacteroidales bacterium]